MIFFLKRWWFAVTATVLATLMILVMLWITNVGLKLDQASAKSAAEAHFNNQMRLALWRLDSALSPIIASEAAKPVETIHALADGTLANEEPTYVIGYFEGDIDHMESASKNPQTSMRLLRTSIPLESRAFVTSIDMNSVRRRTSIGSTALLQKNTLQSFESSSSIDAETFQQNTLQAIDSSESPAEENVTQSAAATQTITPQSQSFDYAQRGNLYSGNLNVQNSSQRQVYNSYATTAPTELPSPQQFVPVWLNGQLILIRALQAPQFQIQGCLLDWVEMEKDCKRAIKDLVPNARFVPLSIDATSESSPPFALASLPIAIEATLQSQQNGLTPMKIAIIGGWCALLFAIVVGALLVYGLWRVSEQRTSFVSAVTHELRTPLTTFRMYSELLANDMIAPEKRARYLHTLCDQSDRLTHLIDNVLTFARLERKAIAKSKTKVTLDELTGLTIDKPLERAKDAGFEVDLQLDDSLRSMELVTDISSVEQIVSNLIDNAIKYASLRQNKRLWITWKRDERFVVLSVKDNGPGITDDMRKKLFLPFSRSAEQAAGSAPGVGLGLALCRRIARAIGGDLRCNAVGDGCEMMLLLPLSSK